MSRLTTATLTANDQVCGPAYVAERATVIVTITGTITVTPQVSHNQGAFLAITDDAMTASGTLFVEGPVVLRLVASGASGEPSAVCSIQADR